MAAMAPDNNDARRTPSIANLLHQASHPSNANLHSLSQLAASMQPVETSTSAQRRRRAAEAFARTTSVPAIMRDQQRFADRSPVQLGVARAGTKRMSRTRSGFTGRMSARAMASVAGEVRESNGIANYASPSPTVLKPAAVTPVSRGSGSDSVESCRAPANNGARYSSVELASSALVGMRRDPADGMEVEYEIREPSSSSHDIKTVRGARGRTTPDAKRAQNRESAKRFRVAQKKRWANLQDDLVKKDKEIARLKDMLQEVTNQKLQQTNSTVQNRPVNQKADELAMAELDLFVKLMCTSDSETGALGLPLSACIGALYRVIVAKMDGTVIGVRHLNKGCGNAMGGEVGAPLWDHVHNSDVAHLRFTVVHASKMVSVMGDDPTVFSYRRKKVEVKNTDSDEVQKETYMRFKGCIYPLSDGQGGISSLILAEFVEI